MKRWFQSHVQPSAVKILVTGLSFALRAWMRTVDTRIADYEPNTDTALQEFRQPAIYSIWHEYIMLPAFTRRGSDLTLLVGLHRDADWMSELSESLGFQIVRGSSSRGGIKAVLKYVKEHKDGSLALTPDGPRGPRRVMSVGCIQLASLLQMPLIPVGCGFDAPFRNRTWDRFAVPRIGSRGRMILGPPMRIPRKLDEARLEAYRVHMEHAMHVVNSEAESWAMDGVPRVGERPLFAAPHATLERSSSLGLIA
jgi:lysophospholipid acyltransferase (LPLAT)-like uncharacterized protein